MSLCDELRGGLIVSVQAWPGSALDDPAVIAAMARAAQEGGAVAVRVQGVENLRAVRARVELPVIGLIKRAEPGFEPYITPSVADVAAIAEQGAEIVAFDATLRRRRDGVTVAALIEATHALGRLAMADCSTLRDGVAAAASGADLLGTTLCGYTAETAGRPLPALDLVRALRLELGERAFVICEGGVQRPEQLRAALAAGADAVVVGSAITNVDWLVREFAGSADTVRNRY
jgi:N-acylglucosamine-6-phosphate 2-epimerase